MHDAARNKLVSTAKDMLQRLETGEIELSEGVLRQPASNYVSTERFEQEKKQLFRRVPLMLAAS